MICCRFRKTDCGALAICSYTSKVIDDIDYVSEDPIVLARLVFLRL